MNDIKITMHTTAGDIEATMYASKTPLTCANFLNLAKRGYYNGIAFHRVIANLMIQRGDPTATGSGGPGYKFGDEFVPELRHRSPGVFSMANAGPGTNGSQFFITHNATPHLDGKHSVFGQVTNGQDVVNKVKQGDKITSITIHDDTTDLFEAQKDNFEHWNSILDKA